MRGKDDDALTAFNKSRITPAYAGKSSAKSWSMVCEIGSPPPMRGKVILYDKIRSALRITPAYAGKRRKKTVSCTGIWDHPRLCGEKWYNTRRGELYVGSPPPMRGKAEHFPPEIMRHRITPAYAGKRKHETDVHFLF